MVINFFATWCPPCRDEIPGFVEIHEKYRARGLVLLLVVAVVVHLVGMRGEAWWQEATTTPMLELLLAVPPHPVSVKARAATAAVVSADSFFISQAPLVRWGWCFCSSVVKQ